MTWSTFLTWLAQGFIVISLLFLVSILATAFVVGVRNSLRK